MLTSSVRKLYIPGQQPLHRLGEIEWCGQCRRILDLIRRLGDSLLHWPPILLRSIRPYRYRLQLVPSPSLWAFSQLCLFAFASPVVLQQMRNRYREWSLSDELCCVPISRAPACLLLPAAPVAVEAIVAWELARQKAVARCWCARSCTCAEPPTSSASFPDADRVGASRRSCAHVKARRMLGPVPRQRNLPCTQEPQVASFPESDFTWSGANGMNMTSFPRALTYLCFVDSGAEGHRNGKLSTCKLFILIDVECCALLIKEPPFRSCLVI